MNPFQSPDEACPPREDETLSETYARVDCIRRLALRRQMVAYGALAGILLLAWQRKTKF